MGENMLMKLHEGMVILYAASVLMYFYDFLQTNRKMKRIGFLLLCCVWFLQTVLFIFNMYETGRFPIFTLADGLYFYSWVLITCSIILNIFVKVEFIIFFTSVLGFMTIVIYTFAPSHWGSPALAEKLASELLLVHITASLVAYALFSLSFLFSLLYIVQYHLLKRKKWGRQLIRANDLVKLEQVAYTLNLLGMPVFSIGVILGLQRLYLKMPEIGFFDWKIIGSFFVIITYACFIYLKTRKEMFGKNLALWNIASFLIVWINFFLLGRLSDFHFWLS